MKVRIAKLQDAKAITGQNISLAQESENIILKPKSVLAGVKSLLSDKKKGFYIVAEDKGVIVGQIMITVEWSDWRNKPIWWVQSVYVNKNYRKRGVFAQLLFFVRQQARAQNVAFLRLYVHKNNRSAIQVYHRTGWDREPYTFYHHRV
jgi:GNAT superfamily N-acetyltransferase